MARHVAARLAVLAWCLAVVLGLAYLGTHWRLEAGVTAFLPRDDSIAATLLRREARGAGPAGAILAVLSSPTGRDASVDAVVDRLRKSGAFSLVAAGPGDLAAAARRLFPYRYLLSPHVDAGTFSEERLRVALAEVTERLQAPAGGADAERLAADPTGAWSHLLADWLGGAANRAPGEAWRTADGRWVLLALPRASPYDLDAQARSVTAVREAAATEGFDAALAGAPAIAVATRDTVRREATRVSLLAGLGVLVLLAAALRPARRVLLCLLPVGSAVLAGMVAVHVVFGALHGIALAFGATLLGLTTDYPVHLLGYGGGRAAARRIRRPLLLGLVSTALGFAALALSGLSGLSQLAVFAVAGLIAAGGTSLLVLPAFAGEGGGLRAWTAWSAHPPAGAWLGWLLGCLIVAGAGVAVPRLMLEPDLGALSPLPAELRHRDAAAREAIGLAGGRHLLVVRAQAVQTALRATEAAAGVLNDSGGIAFHSVAGILPSRATQRRRQAALPPPEVLRRRLAAAANGLPLRAEGFAPFVEAVAESRQRPPLTPASLGDGPVGQWLSGLLFRRSGGWHSLVRLGAPLESETLAQVQRAVTGTGATVEAVDLKADVEAAVARYQRQVVRYSLIGGVAIAVVLVWGLSGWRARVRTALVTVSGLAGALIWLAASSAALSLFHLASLLLVGGLALDYGLFTGDRRTGTVTTSVCVLSTVIAFAALASANTPVLHDIGTTVVAGAVTAWLVAWLSQKGAGGTQP
ncbi:MMPL family transporter [Arhodomonas sp. AD133]|uniref:MMPL family transporter n=1 Tax=Arhodomonas sp. AD133 TaxID=3415009 RepID=UPI003EBC150C